MGNRGRRLLSIETMTSKPPSHSKKVVKLIGGHRYGRNYTQDMMLLDAIKEGKKYVVFESIDNRVHIIPDAILKEMLTHPSL
jgi:hypothetical protein